MIEESNFETYLYISPYKYGIYLLDKDSFKVLYKNEINVNEKTINHENITQFLDDNIFKIEKFISKFIKNIFLIIKNSQILNLKIGIKKKIYDQINNPKNLENLLIETKNLFRKNYQDQKIMHMLIDSDFNNDNISKFKEDVAKAKEICLEINFISISNDSSSQIEKILGKYQIKIIKYLDGDYINDFFQDQDIEFPVMICKILNGININEVSLVPKNEEKRGFFEKFFQLFS